MISSYFRKPPSNALVLCGGGARASFQSGVLSAINEIQLQKTTTPFQILCGASAGAINAAYLGAKAQNFHLATQGLEKFWSEIHFDHIFSTNELTVLSSALRWQYALLPFKFLKPKIPLSLLEVAPLKKMLGEQINFEALSNNIERGVIKSLNITCSNYASGESTTFFETQTPTIQPWKKQRRSGQKDTITAQHLLASSSIPFIFPAQKIREHWFGDGSIRQVSPVSPAIHNGARNILIVSCNRYDKVQDITGEVPTIANLAGHMLGGLFSDNLPTDIERIQTLNELMKANRLMSFQKHIRPLNYLHIQPSLNVDEEAQKHIHKLPRNLFKLFKRIGLDERSGAHLASYLLFEKSFTQALIQDGYTQALRYKKEILNLLAA